MFTEFTITTSAYYRRFVMAFVRYRNYVDRKGEERLPLPNGYLPVYTRSDSF